MLSFDPRNNSDRENYNILTNSVIPRPIAFVTSMTKTRVINGAPFSYFNAVSSNPPMLSVAVDRRSSGDHKDTARNIIEQKEFVIHVVDADNINQVNESAEPLPSNVSEVEKVNLTPVESTSISVPGIREAKVRYECKLEHVIELKENGKVVTDLIVGRVVRFHIENDIYENGSVQHEKINAVASLGDSVFAKIGESFTIPFPNKKQKSESNA